MNREADPQNLEFAYVLNAGTVHEGTPFSDFFIYASPYMLFLAFNFFGNLQP
jgi:hypothetical protein